MTVATQQPRAPGRDTFQPVGQPKQAHPSPPKPPDAVSRRKSILPIKMTPGFPCYGLKFWYPSVPTKADGKWMFIPASDGKLWVHHISLFLLV
jgi:hypothetical protein